MKPGDEIRASLANLPAHSTIGVKVVVVNTHYQGPPSQVVEVYTPEGGKLKTQGGGGCFRLSYIGQ